MHYWALLAAVAGGPAAVPGTDEYAASMQRHQEFWSEAQEAVAGGGLHPDAAVALAAQIPVGPEGCVELRQIVAD